MHVSRQTSQAERTYSIERFREVATKALELSSTMTEHDLSVLLVYLAREKEAICYDQQVSLPRILGDWCLTVNLRSSNSDHAKGTYTN